MEIGATPEYGLVGRVMVITDSGSRRKAPFTRIDDDDSEILREPEKQFICIRIALCRSDHGVSYHLRCEGRLPR